MVENANKFVSISFHQRFTNDSKWPILREFCRKLARWQICDKFFYRDLSTINFEEVLSKIIYLQNFSIENIPIIDRC